MRVVTEIFIFISLIHTVLSMAIPTPVNLTISSEHLVHLLSWRMGPGSPAGVHYTVSMRSTKNTKVTLVKGCEKVTSPLQCNLTEAFSNPTETYYTNVSAVLGTHTSAPARCSSFKPIENSVLESPLVNVTVFNTSLCVSLQSPSPKLHDSYNSFSFQLNITSVGRPQIERNVEGLEKETVDQLMPGTRYCVTVSIKKRRHTSRPAVCVSTPNKPDNISVIDVLIALGICLLMVLLVMWAVPRLLSHVLSPKVDLPKVLNFQDHHKVYRVLLVPTESISTLTEDTDALQKMKQNTDEHEETDTDEDGVMYERLATQHFQAQDTSSSSVMASDSWSGCGPLVNQSSADDQSSGCRVYEGDGFSDSPHLPTETRPLLKCVHELDGAAALKVEDVNLCSVLLHRDTSFSDAHEFELIPDLFDTPVNIHMSDCEQDSEEEYSEYLSRS